MTREEVLEKLNKLKEDYNAYLKAETDFRNSQEEFENMLCEFPSDSVARFMDDDENYSNSHYCFNTVKIVPFKNNEYAITTYDEFRGEITYYKEKTVTENDFIDFLTNNNELVEKKKEEERNSKKNKILPC